MIKFCIFNISQNKINKLQPDAIILSPQEAPWWVYPESRLSKIKRLVRSFNIPTLGICGGHQLLIMSYGGEVAPIRGTKRGKTYEGRIAEKGFIKIRHFREPEIFKNIPVESFFYESHTEEAKNVPDEFQLMAFGEGITQIQGVKHISKPLYGVQFHPENYNAEYPY